MRVRTITRANHARGYCHYLRQVAQAILHQILEPPWSRNDHVYAFATPAPQCGYLFLLRNSAVQASAADVALLPDLGDDRCALQGELSSRCEDEHEWPPLLANALLN